VEHYSTHQVAVNAHSSDTDTKNSQISGQFSH
jgi:hypothetical protein